MRVVSGVKRGIKLTAVSKTARPTSDMAKESLFNILGLKVTGSRFLDLFAGSGAVGIEALSRGAELTYFIDSSSESIKAINTNLNKIGYPKTGSPKNLNVIKQDVFKYLNNLFGLSLSFDIIFADPPYEADYFCLLLKAVYSSNLLDNDGLIVYETDSKNDFLIDPELANVFTVTDMRCYGRTKFIFVRKNL